MNPNIIRQFAVATRGLPQPQRAQMARDAIIRVLAGQVALSPEDEERQKELARRYAQAGMNGAPPGADEGGDFRGFVNQLADGSFAPGRYGGFDGAGADPSAPAAGGGVSAGNQADLATNAANSGQAAGPRQAEYDLLMEDLIWKDGKPPLEVPTVFNHNYHEASEICANGDAITKEQMADALSRFALPRRRLPHAPVVSGEEYSVYDPHTGIYGGEVLVSVFNNGLSVRNKTSRKVHVFDGQITRTAERRGNSWWVKTTGYGKIDLTDIDLRRFLDPRNLSHVPNQIFGPVIFDTVDARMRQWLSRRCRGGRRR